jgi:hypothetical protein
MATADEGKLFRAMIRHSVTLVAVLGLMALLFAYAVPSWIPG